MIGRGDVEQLLDVRAERGGSVRAADALWVRSHCSGTKGQCRRKVTLVYSTRATSFVDAPMYCSPPTVGLRVSWDKTVSWGNREQR